MSSERKSVKILSLVLLVWGIICAVLGIVLVATMAGLSVFSTGAAILLVIEWASAVLALAMGATGVRGANTPSKIGPFVTLSLVAVIVEAAGLVVTAVNSDAFGLQLGQALASGVFMLALAVASLVLGRKVREQARD